MRAGCLSAREARHYPTSQHFGIHLCDAYHIVQRIFVVINFSCCMCSQLSRRLQRNMLLLPTLVFIYVLTHSAIRPIQQWTGPLLNGTLLLVGPSHSPMALMTAHPAMGPAHSPIWRATTIICDTIIIYFIRNYGIITV